MKKIPTLFKRVFDEKTHKIVDISPELTTPDFCCFLEPQSMGEATEKWDGSCCAIIDGQFYLRYDAKKGKPIPENAIKCQEEADPITGHLPCWVPADRNNPSDKWYWAAYDYSSDWFKAQVGKRIRTYEAIGKHFNGNPYNLNYDMLVPHGDNIVEVPRTFEGIKGYLETHNIEGLVFWLDDEPVCKIKRSDFGFEWQTKKR